MRLRLTVQRGQYDGGKERFRCLRQNGVGRVFHQNADPALASPHAEGTCQFDAVANTVLADQALQKFYNFPRAFQMTAASNADRNSHGGFSFRALPERQICNQDYSIDIIILIRRFVNSCTVLLPELPGGDNTK
ncbi:hypothetical protein SDC9_99594 [bioreactor metagenome]|uniref:Uncharacterized protein n=1 Tax=bioreactor metagenome TaxID=1076179 RepID=A0A645AKK6_9ZZZZ